jgi:hypothetical protein
MDKEFLFNHASNVWRGIEAEGRAFPANNISIAISGFGDIEDGVQGIQSFLVRGQTTHERTEISGKRKRDDSGIAKFFPKRESEQEEAEDKIPSDSESEKTYICPKCQKAIEFQEMEVHEDYHVALELSKGSPTRVAPAVQGRGTVIGKEEKKGPKKKSKVVEKGQKRLEFGL